MPRPRAWPPSARVAAGRPRSAAEGARACFGIGTNNCCGEFMVLGVIAAVTGNLPALAIATGASYAYCYN